MPSDLSDVLKCLHGSKSPLVILGRRARFLTRHIEFISILNRLGAPIISSIDSIFNLNCRSYWGQIGFGANPKVQERLHRYRPDRICVIGLRLDELSTAGWPTWLTQAERIFVFDKNAETSTSGLQNATSHEISFEIFYNIDNLDISNKFDAGDTDAWPTDYLGDGDNSFEQVGFDFQPSTLDQGLVHPSYLMHCLSSMLPRNAIIINDIGNSMVWIARHLRIADTQSHFQPIANASMGSGIGMGLGAKIAIPEAPVSIITGDAAALMQILEAFSMPPDLTGLIFIVLNDGGHGMVHHGTKMLQLDVDVRYKDFVSFGMIANSIGYDHLTINNNYEICKILEHCDFQKARLFIDVAIDKNVKPPIVDRAKIVVEG